MKGEMHVHTYLGGDCNLKVETIIDVSRRRGIDFVVLTDHNYLYLEAEEIGKKEDFPVYAATEYSSCDGHVLVYGLRDDAWLHEPWKSMQEVIDFAEENNAVAIPSHPYLKRRKEFLGDKIFGLTGLVAVETINRRLPDELNQLAEDARQRLGLKAIGSSDTHFSSNLGKVFTEFEADIGSMEDLVRELREGEYHPVDLR